ncbi:manganese efflux pump MntP [Bacillus carboniphilus]
MDAFSVGLGMGLIKLKNWQILYIGLIIGFFHLWMPLIGILIGRFLTDTLGSLATYTGGSLLLILGLQMVSSSFSNQETMFYIRKGIGLFFFALSVSLDSFSVGLSLGIFGAKMAVTLMLFAFTSMILTWIGLFLGSKVQGWFGSYSEALGGCILVIFGLKLILMS